MLEVIGLDAEVEQVYEVLLNSRPATVDELAAATGLAPSTVRTALRALSDRGLVNAAPDGSAGYVAVDPALVLDMLLLRREEELRKARVLAAEISERFRQAVAGRDPAEMVEVVTGTETIVERYDQVLRTARRELRFLDKPPYHPGYQFRHEPDAEFLRGGGVARVLYETAAVDDPHRLPALEASLAAGERARVLPGLPTKLVLVDDRAGIVPLRITGNIPSGSYLIVHRSALLDALGALFETLWGIALPLTLGGGVPPPAGAGPGWPDPLERRILGLMNAGLRDEAIARHLNLSHRTLQRRIRGIMERLDAHTRYQLGARAAARGWAEDGRSASTRSPY
ncbi:MAG TPA: helix-turn-helix domain-containing protein [Streptosporangiaceae bacterium]|nr:helix-turn-helix domain-containing protein [Streptosporangiaceae bacterium]